MTALAWAISVIFSIYVTYNYRRLVDEVKILKVQILPRRETPIPVPPKHTATVIDGDDQIMAAKIEYEERFKNMNPELHGDGKDEPRR